MFIHTQNNDSCRHDRHGHRASGSFQHRNEAGVGHVRFQGQLQLQDSALRAQVSHLLTIQVLIVIVLHFAVSKLPAWI